MQERLRRVLRTRRTSLQAQDSAWQERVKTLEARVKHLESELEGFQDAVHRRSVATDEEIEELRRRTAPKQLARDLSEDARRRGL